MTPSSFPWSTSFAVLAEEGLAAAVKALAEEAQISLAITALPEERLGPSVEAAAYFVVSETIRQNAASPLVVCAERRNGRLIVDVTADAAPESLLDLEDRVGALDGTVEVVRGRSGRVTIRAEIPCGS